MSLFSVEEIQSKLKSLDGWVFEKNQIEKTYQHKDFANALKFVNALGEEAEKMDHHPDIFIHSWNKVKITISTHSEGGVTQKDFLLAGKIDALY
ncbi:MAG: 4a-hydroxytetrahydrobiopterin dehydratase [Ignavibacteriales bacterium]|nr:MAG: 4a-hydroxytetrahydrobiopterin dehydratase [Ignavibacteriales bacterium]